MMLKICKRNRNRNRNCSNALHSLKCIKCTKLLTNCDFNIINKITVAPAIIYDIQEARNHDSRYYLLWRLGMVCRQNNTFVT